MTPGGALGRLAGRSPGAIAGRARQILRARLERLGLDGARRRASSRDLLTTLASKGGPSTAEAALAAFRERLASSSLEAFRDPERTSNLLREGWPGGGAAARERAERASRGRFDLLGFTDLDFGVPIDWHLDPTSGRRAPLRHWSRVSYLDHGRVGDHKVIWELSRHRIFLDLGRAYWSSGEERWARDFASLVEDWMERNPPKLGINWASSLEVSFRAIAWCWALHFFGRSEALRPELYARMLAWLRVGGRHVERYVSTWFSPNTHLTGEALGLVYLGTLFPELPEAERWVRKGTAWLLDALDVQILDDGGYFEQSTWYHRYTADFYLHLWLLTELRGEVIGPRLRARLEAIVDHMAALVRPDGGSPLIGDDDGGRLIFLDERDPDDFRSPLLTAAVLFERPDWAGVGGPPSEELLWLLGPDGVARLNGLGAGSPDRSSRGLADSGFFVMRSGRDRRADYAVVRCGPHGALSGGHAHADALSVELSVAGERLLVDPGTGSYMVADIREALRATAAHNTVTVDGASSCEPEGPFSWRTKTAARAEAWCARDWFGFVRGGHDGFARLRPGTRHERAVLWLAGGLWLLDDRVRHPPGGIAVEARFQFAPGLDVAPDGEALAVTDPGGEPLARMIPLAEGGWRSVAGRVSPVYGALVEGAAWAWTAREPLREGSGTGALTLIADAGTKPTRLEAEGGRAWRLEPSGTLLALRDPAAEHVRAAEAGLESDFRWTCWSPASAGRPRIVAIEGRRLRRAGYAPLELPDAVACLAIDGAGGAPPVVQGGEPPDLEAVDRWLAGV